MDDEVSVVHQNPLRCIIAFHTDRQLSRLLQLLSNFIGNRVALPWIGNGTDQEVVSERGDFSKIENPQVESFLGFGCAYGDQPVRKLLRGECRLGLCGTACQSRLNVLLRLAYYSDAGGVNRGSWTAPSSGTGGSVSCLAKTSDVFSREKFCCK